MLFRWNFRVKLNYMSFIEVYIKEWGVMDLDFIKKLVKPNDSKIIMLVLDGVGGLPTTPGGLTELETANTPNLDKLAKEGICGLQLPIASGITPGSGPGHLGIFGFAIIVINQY